MADKVGLGSGSVPPQNIPPVQVDNSKTEAADGSEAPSRYFYEVAKAGYAAVVKYAETIAPAQAPQEIKPEEAPALFDRAKAEFQQSYKEGGTEVQARAKLDAMQAAMPALLEGAKAPEVQAYLKVLQEVTPEEAVQAYDHLGTIDSGALKKGIGAAPKVPAKARMVFEILSRMRALEAAKHRYFSKYHRGSQEELGAQAFYKQKKAEALLQEMGRQLREEPISPEKQRLLVRIDLEIGDRKALLEDMRTWKEAARDLSDPASRGEELSQVLGLWSDQYGKNFGLDDAEIWGEIQAVKTELVATLRENPKIISYEGKPIPAGPERARSMLDRIFPPPPSSALVRRDLLPKLSLEGMAAFALLEFEAEEAVMSAVKKTQVGDVPGAKEDYLQALGYFAELRDEAAAQAMDGKIRELLGQGGTTLEVLQAFGRMHVEVQGTGLKLETQLKEEIGSIDVLRGLLEPAMRLTQGGAVKTAQPGELLQVAEELVQVLKVRQEAGVSNDDAVLWTELDRLQLLMGRAAEAEGVSAEDKRKLREQVVRLDIARIPEVAGALANPHRGEGGGGLLDKISHPERGGAIGVGILAEYRGAEMLQHLEAWQAALFQSELKPEEELNAWADMSAVLALYQPLTRLGEKPPISQSRIEDLAKPVVQSIETLAPKLIQERFPELAERPELPEELGADLAKLGSRAMTQGDVSFAAVLRDPKALEAFIGLTLEAKSLESQAKALEADMQKLREDAPNFAKLKAQALCLHMQAAELYAKRGGPAERVKIALKPAMDFFEEVASDPKLPAADRAEAYLDIAKLYRAAGLAEDADQVYAKVLDLGLERERQLNGSIDARLQVAVTLARGERALLKSPPDYDVAKANFRSLPGVKEAEQRHDAIVAYQRSQRLPKVFVALEAVASEYAQKLEARKGKADAERFLSEFRSRAAVFQEKLADGRYRTVEELFEDFGYVRHDPLRGHDVLKWVAGETDSIDWKAFNGKSLALLRAATNPESTDQDFARLGLDMGTYLGSAGDFDLFQAGATDVAYFSAASQILGMMEKDQYVGGQAKSYREGISDRAVKHAIAKELGNLSVVGAENLGEAAKSGALWLVPAGFGRLAGTSARLLGASERLSVIANVAGSSLSAMLVESAWTGNWNAFTAQGLATTGLSTFVGYFGYRHIARISHGLGEAAKRSAWAGQRVAGQAAMSVSARVLLELGEFSAGGLFETGMAFAQEALGIQEVNAQEKNASLWWRGFRHFLVGGFTELRENAGEKVAGNFLDAASGGKLTALERRADLKERVTDFECAAKSFGWDLDFKSAGAWIDERRPADPARPGEKELAALMAMDPKRLAAIAKDPGHVAQARAVVQRLYPGLAPDSWDAQVRVFGVLDYFQAKGGKSTEAQFSDFQKSAESLGLKSPEQLRAFYELAYQGLTPTQAKKYAQELAADSAYQAKLDASVDAYYAKPGAALDADLRARLRGDAVLGLFQEAVEQGKSPKKLLDNHAAELRGETTPSSPEAAPVTVVNYAGLPWTLGDIYEGFAKLLGITTRKAAKERGWKALDAWVEASDRAPLRPSEDATSEALAKTIAQGGKKLATAMDTLVEGSGIQHPGLSERLQGRFEEMKLDAKQVATLAKQAGKFRVQLDAIAAGLLGKGSLDTPQGQLLAAELLLKAVETGVRARDFAQSSAYLEQTAKTAAQAKPGLDVAAEIVLQAKDVHAGADARSLKTTLFLKALQDSAMGKTFSESLDAWTESALLGRVAEVLLETEATGVSTPQGRLRIAKKFIAMLGSAKSPKDFLSALYPGESRPIPLSPQGIASLEEVGGQARTKYGKIEVEDGKARLFPNPGRKVEVYNPVAKTWLPAKEGQPLQSGTWIRQAGKDLGRKLFTLTPEGEVYLEEIGAVAGRMEAGGSVMRALHDNFPAWFGAGEALSFRAYGDLTKIVPEFFRRVERDLNPDWDRWYAEIESAVSALEPAVQALPAHQRAEFRIALMRKLVGGELTAERARAIAAEVLESPLDPALFPIGEAEPFGDFLGDFEARQPKQDYGDVFGDEAPLGAHGLSGPEIDVFGDGAEMPPASEELVPQAIAAAEEDWWLGGEAAPDTESVGVDAVENVLPFLPSPRSKAPTVEYPDLRAAARLGQPDAIDKTLGQETIADRFLQTVASEATPASLATLTQVKLDALAAMATIEVGRKLAGFPLLGRTTLQEEPGRLTVSIGVPGRGYATELAENLAARLRKEHPQADVKVVQGKGGAVFVIARDKGSDRVIAFNLRFKAEASPAPEDMLAYAKQFEEKYGEKFAALAKGDVKDSPESSFVALSSQYHAVLRPREALQRLLEIGPKVRALAPEMEGRWLALEAELANGSRADLAPDSELTAYLKAKEEMAVYEKTLREYERSLELPTPPEVESEIVPERPGVNSEEIFSTPVDREAVTEMDLPAVPPPAVPPRSDLLAGAHRVVLQAIPFLPVMPIFVDAVLNQGLLAGGAQLAAGWIGKIGDKMRGWLSGAPAEEAIPADFRAPVAAKIDLKPVLVRDGGGEGIAIGGDGDRSSDGKILGQFHIPGLIAGVKFHYLDDYGVPKLYPAGTGGVEVQVRLKADEYQVKTLKLTLDGIDFENGDQIVLPHAQGSVTLTLRIRQEGGKDVYEVESSRPLVDLGLEGLPIGFPAGENAFTFGERNEDNLRATAAGGVGAIQNPQTYGKIEKVEDGSFLLRPLAPCALRQIFLVDAQGAETLVTQPTRIVPGQKILVKNPTDPDAASNRILFCFEHEAGPAAPGAPAMPPRATPSAPDDGVSPLEAGSYVWEAGLDIRYLPESTDVAIRHPNLMGEDVLALLRRDGQDLWVLPSSEVVQVLDAEGRSLGLESGFDSQTGKKISQGYRVPELAYLRIGDKLYARQGTKWAPSLRDPWSGRSLRQTGDLEFEIPDKNRPSSDTALTPVTGPMPAPEIRAAAAVDSGAGKVSVENLPLAIQDNQADKPRRAAYAQNQPTFAYGSFAAHTDEGFGGKALNEDAYGVLPEYGVAVVADGMGGMGGGDKASAVAVRKLAELVKDPDWDGDLKQALILAGRAVNQEVNPPDDPSKKAGTTAVVQRVVQKDGRSFAEIAHVGDAGALVLRPKPDGSFEVVFATREQSVVAEWRDMGSLKNTMEMRWSPHAHVVSGGLGLRKDAKPEFASVELQPGDWTLLFSDGIGDNFSKDELSVLVQGSKTPEEARDKILAALRLKMERLQTGSAQLEAGQDVFLVPVQARGATIEDVEMVPVGGLQDYYLGGGGKVVGRAVQLKDTQGQVRTGVEVPWAEGRFAVRNAKGETEYFQGEAVQGLDYFLPVDRYKADNISIHVYKHELLPAPVEEEWRIDDVLDETPYTLVSDGLPTVKVKLVEGEGPPPPTVKLAPLAEEISPTHRLLQAVSAPKHPEEPGAPSSPILARVGTKEIDLSVATKEPQVVYREGPVDVELSVDAIGRYLLKGRGFNWGSKPVAVEFEGKKFQLSRMKPSAPPLEVKPAPSNKPETQTAESAVETLGFKRGLSESKGELAASDIPLSASEIGSPKSE